MNYFPLSFIAFVSVFGCILLLPCVHLRTISLQNEYKTGNSKPPTLNRLQLPIVSQPPSDLQNDDILVPPHQHKVLRHFRLPNYDEITPQTGHQSRRLYPNNRLGSKLSPTFPVAGKVKVRGSKPIGAISTVKFFLNDDHDLGGSWETFTSTKWDLHLQKYELKFIPYIGATALTNIPKFFKHLQENAKALHTKYRNPTGIWNISRQKKNQLKP